MWRRFGGALVPVCGALLFCVAPAAAENVHVQIECGNPPRTAPTDHRAEAEGLVVEDTAYQGGLAIPRRGRILRLRIDERELTLPTGSIRDGFVDTAELGPVFLSLHSADPGYFLVVRPEQLEAIASRPAPGGGLPSAARATSTPLVERDGIRQ